MACIALLAVILILRLCLPGSLGSARNTSTIQTVPGENYQICTNQATQYLTSPWTYDALPSGQQTYTVAQYEALSGYGTTLPPLPSYISSESSSTTAAEIFAPGSTQVDAPAYDFPNTPILYFYEGGSYGFLGSQTISGDEFFGGSAPGFPEPVFNDGGNASGIDSGNDSYNFSGEQTTLTATSSAGSSTVTLAENPSAYAGWVTFSDGSTYSIASTNGTQITLNTTLTSTETSGSNVWTSSSHPIGKVGAGVSQGATSFSVTNAAVPLVQFGSVIVGANTYEMTSISGSESSGYTAGVAGMDTNVAANTPIFYAIPAGGVTVEYLNINDDLHNTTGTINMGPGWIVKYNNIHDGYSASAPGSGVAIYGGDESTVEYNCFARMGDYGGGGAGTNEKFDYNEVYQDANEPDPGCGCSGGGKWWGTLNTDIVDNAFVLDGIGGGQGAVWLDNGNTGARIEGNYFYKIAGPAVDNETGYNMLVDNNLFLDDGWENGSGQGSNNDGTVDLNSSGGMNIPGSRYENSISISNNYFINDWQGVSIWQSGLRTCLASGEGWPDDASYCSGGYPNTNTTAAGNQYYISHEGNDFDYGTTTLAANAPSGSSTVLIKNNEAINDQIDFKNPSRTSTSDTTNVTSFTGSGTLNAASTSGFPSSGQLRVDTSNGNAVLSYTGTTATIFTGVTLITDPQVASSGTLSGSISVNDPLFTTTTSTANVTSFTGSQTLATASTSGFPSSGQLRVGTTADFADAGGGYTGAILSYTGILGSSFTGVSLVRGTGTLSGSGSNPAPIQQIQPYKVTNETCYSNDCAVSITPNLSSSVVAGDEVTNAGTCSLFATSVSTPTSPMAPSTPALSYWDGCQWQPRNISVSSNDFVFQPSQISASAPPMGGGTTTSCNGTNNCGLNFMAYQACGTLPFCDQTDGNAMMSSTTFTSCPVWDTGCATDPLANLNALASPAGAAANNGETPYNNVWSNNTYIGPWSFEAYNFGPCWPLPTDGVKSLPSGACGLTNYTDWQSDWQQDTGSSFSPLAVSINNLTNNQQLHGSSQSVTAYEDTQSGSSISTSLLVGSTTDSTVSTLSSSPHTFTLNTLNYHDGQYTLKVAATDSGGNSGNDSVPVYIANGDLNSDGSVNLSDLAIMAAHWGQTDANYSDGNITGQSSINLSDLAVLAANWNWTE